MAAFDAPTAASRVPPDGWEAEARRLELERDIARARALTRKWTALAAIVLAALLAWFFRWEVVPAAASDRPPAAFAVDRLTGQMLYIQQDGSLPVQALK
jgi:hypothetical protein